MMSEGMAGRMHGWHVSDEPSLSDHAHICFKIGEQMLEKVQYRNPRNTNWVSYKENLRARLDFDSTNGKRIHSAAQLDKSADGLTSAIVGSFDLSCPVITKTDQRYPGGALNWPL
uniref:Endonuclease/exonuclease/phosphatase domain-containing protein n=1 Tax=Homalodisca liturata TaxID=320908 RepID=A0A1B6HZ26_9HEMI